MKNALARAWERLRLRQISKAQAREIERLLTPAAARALGGRNAYCRLTSAFPANGRPSRVLEVGCGPGRFVALFCGLGYEVVGIDVARFPEWEQIRRQGGAQLLEGIRAESLPFEDGSFDHAVCLGALLYFDDPARALREIHRVVRPGGRVLIRTVNRGNLYTRRTGRRLDPASKNLYTLSELRQLVESNGFSVLEGYAHGFWPPIATDLWWYLSRVWLPLALQDWLSGKLAADRRVNNIVLAGRP